MSKKDTKAKEYMADNNRFADLCNLVLFNGENIISAEDLVEKDSTEVLSVLGVSGTEVKHEQKWRDLLKSAIIKISNKAVFVLIGVENQSDIHYAMPVKSLIYDALSYGSQVKEAAKKHKKNKDYDNNAEFLSGFKKSDKITPVIPITLYLGAEKWDAPTSLYDMFEDLDDRLKPFIPDYKLLLVSPANLSPEDLDKLDTELREFLGAIKYSNNKDDFEEFIFSNEEFENLDNETVSAINVFTGAGIKITKKGGKTNVCKAIKEMKEEYANEVAAKKNAEEIVNAVESIMKNFKVSLEEACVGLNYTLDKYHNAKSLIS